MTVVAFVVIFVLGFVLGVLTMGLLVAASRSAPVNTEELDVPEWMSSE